MKTTRVQFELPEQSMERLKSLKELTEAVSYAEVVKNALKIYEAKLLAEQRVITIKGTMK